MTGKRRAAVTAAGALCAGLLAFAAQQAHSHRALSAAAQRPCGGEALDEDTFPAFPGLLASTPAPGAPDGRPEQFLPAPTTFQALQAKVEAPLRLSQFRTNFSHASPSQAANIALVARRLNGTVIPPGAVFSYNHVAGPFTAAGGYGWGRMFVGERIVPTIGGGVCQGSSTLYNVVLLANLPTLEVHRHGLTVPYLPPGRDATVTESGGLDFRFRNNTGAPLLLWAEARDRWLSIALYGRTAPPPVDIHTEVLAETPFSTVMIQDPQLPPGSERVAAPGQMGVRARTWVVVHAPAGTQTHNLGVHTYRPSPRIILRGPGTPVQSSSGTGA